MSEKKSILDTTLAKWIMAILTVVSVAWGFYGNFHTKEPKLVYEIQSQAVLFNKTEELSSVQLLVDTVDVLKSDQNISIVSLRVRNIGNESLRASDYDEGAFGLMLKGGTILKEVTLSESLNQHIEERFKELSPSTAKSFVEIPKIALDEDEWYIISIAILHDNNTKPAFTPTGKIIGQNKIEVVYASAEEPSFGKQLFNGGWGVIIVRFLLYIVIALVVIMIIAGITISISEAFDKRKRESVKHMIASDSGIVASIRDDYLSAEDAFIRIAEHYFNLGERRMNKAYARAEHFISNIANLRDNDYDKYRSIYRDINNLADRGYLIRDGQGQFTIPREIKESVQKVSDILKKEKYKSYRSSFMADMYDGIEYGEIDITTIDHQS